MLSDDELDHLAQAEVRPAHQHREGASESRVSIIAVRRFALTAPPGAFYVQQVVPDDSVGMLGTVGFFVDRRTGKVRHISPAEFLYAADAVATHTGLKSYGEVTPASIEWLLTHPIDESLLARGAFRPPQQRRWWEFWK